MMRLRFAQSRSTSSLRSTLRRLLLAALLCTIDVPAPAHAQTAISAQIVSWGNDVLHDPPAGLDTTIAFAMGDNALGRT